MIVDFTNDNNKNPKDAYIIDYTFNPSFSSDILVGHVIVDANGLVNASAFDKIQKVPVVVDDVKKRTTANMADSYLLPSDQQQVCCSSHSCPYTPTHLTNWTRQVWFSLTFKKDVRVIKKAGEMHDKLVDEFKA